jgi:hypothetical protein
MIHEEGLPAVYARHAAMATRAAIEPRRWGSRLCFRSSTLVADTHGAQHAAGVSPKVIKDRLEQRGIPRRRRPRCIRERGHPDRAHG